MNLTHEFRKILRAARDGSWREKLGAIRTAPVRSGLIAAGVLTLAVVGFAAQRGAPVEDGERAASAEAAASTESGASSPEVGAVAGDSAVSGRAGSPEGGSAEAEAEGDAAVAATPAPIDWAAPTAPSPVTPVPASERVTKPDAVRGIYVGAWSVGGGKSLDRLIRLADETEVNAFVIDIKDVTGQVSHRTRVPLAVQVGAADEPKIGDMRAVLERLKAHGIYPIARIVVFKDPLLANARPEWSIVRKDGSIWEDNNGVHWVDSYNRSVWEYNIELAREAVALGFSEVQWDYVRFPDVPRSYLVEAVYPARDGRTKSQGIRAFMAYAQERLADLDVPVTADVFGVTTSAFGDVGIGQVWEDMADVIDVLLPMVYPSHYPRGTWDFPNPNAAPYQIVKKALDHGVSRSRDLERPAAIRPWLQAFSLGQPEYGPEHIRAQIDAVYDAGLTEWILWHPGVRYPREAFATADGVEPWFAGQGASLYVPEPKPDSVPAGEAVGDPVGQPVGQATGGGSPVR